MFMTKFRSNFISNVTVLLSNKKKKQNNNDAYHFSLPSWLSGLTKRKTKRYQSNFKSLPANLKLYITPCEVEAAQHSADKNAGR